jgi:hypothetical protein
VQAAQHFKHNAGVNLRVPSLSILGDYCTPVIPGRFFANHSSGATGTIVGAIAGAFAAGARSEWAGAVVLGSPPSLRSSACGKG